VGRFDEVMTAGKGYIGLAAMIFAWNPIGAFRVAAVSFAVRSGFLQILRANPSEFLLIARIVTMIVLAGVVGRAAAAAAMAPYELDHSCQWAFRAQEAEGVPRSVLYVLSGIFRTVVLVAMTVFQGIH
jgi:hypothetical protein